LIEQVEDTDNQQYFLRMYQSFFQIASQAPFQTLPIFDYFKTLLEDVLYNIPAIADKTRLDEAIWDAVYIPYLEDQEKKKKLLDDEAKIKAEWLKQAKKKKWTDEDEKALLEGYKKKLSESINTSILRNFHTVERDAEFIKLRRQIENKERPLVEHFEGLARKKPLYDMDIEGRRVMIKAHLSISDWALKQKFEEEIVF